MTSPAQATPRWLMICAAVASTLSALLLVLIFAGLAPTHPSPMRIAALTGVWAASAVALLWVGGRAGRLTSSAQLTAVLGSSLFAALS